MKGKSHPTNDVTLAHGGDNNPSASFDQDANRNSAIAHWRIGALAHWRIGALAHLRGLLAAGHRALAARALQRQRPPTGNAQAYRAASAHQRQSACMTLPAEAFQTITWREGTNEPLSGRFAA